MRLADPAAEQISLSQLQLPFRRGLRISISFKQQMVWAAPSARVSKDAAASSLQATLCVLFETLLSQQCPSVISVRGKNTLSLQWQVWKQKRCSSSWRPVLSACSAGRTMGEVLQEIGEGHEYLFRGSPARPALQHAGQVSQVSCQTIQPKSCDALLSWWNLWHGLEASISCHAASLHAQLVNDDYNCFERAFKL